MFTANYKVYGITHPTHQVIGDKFSFFAEALDLMNAKAGRFLEFELDTHVSFVESMIFIAEMALKEGGREKLAISEIAHSICKHPLFSKDDLIIKEHYLSILDIIEEISKFESESKGKNQIFVLKEILKDLKRINNKLSTSYVPSLVDRISNIFICNHTLNFHRNDLSYLAKLVYSYFYLSGYSKHDISFFVNKLLSNKIRRHGDRLYSDPPLPKDLYERVIVHNKEKQPYNQQLHIDLNEFIENRTQKQQVEGFLNLAYYEKHIYNFMYRIHGFYIEEDDLRIFDLKLRSIDSMLKRDTAKDIWVHIDNENSCLAEVEIKAYSYEEAVELGITTVENAINRIRLYKKRNIYLDRTSVFGYNGQTYYRNSINNYTSIDNRFIDYVNFKENKIRLSPHSEFIESKQNILIEALSETNKERYIGLHWRLVDVMIAKAEKKVSKSGKVRKKVLAISYLMIFFERNSLKGEIRNWAYNMIINSTQYSSDLGLTYKEVVDIQNRKRPMSLKEINTKFKHQHTQFHVRRAINFSRANVIDRFNFYTRYFINVARHRNVYEHMGDLDDNLTRKIHASIHDVLQRLINQIGQELSKKKNSEKTVEEVLLEMINEGRRLVNQ